MQGSSGDTDIENRLIDAGNREERVSRMERVIWKLTLPYVKLIANGICCMSQETQTGALYLPRGVGWGGRWEGGPEGRGCMYTYG